jgi:hypothetical protein
MFTKSFGACCIENGSSFHSFGPEYVKVYLKSSVIAFGICNFSLTTFRREYRFLSDKYWILFKIDSNLNGKNQIDQVCSKISSKIYLLSKIKTYLNLESRQLFLNL